VLGKHVQLAMTYAAGPDPIHFNQTIWKHECASAGCARFCCTASEEGYADFCCRSCAETGKHSPECDQGDVFQQARLVPGIARIDPGPYFAHQKRMMDDFHASQGRTRTADATLAGGNQ